MASPNAFYSVQPAFTGGEISGDVASRIDLDKYQVALLQAENAIANTKTVSKIGLFIINSKF